MATQFFKRFKSAFGKLIYMPNGEFSLTRIFMVVTFTFAILLIPVGIVFNIFGIEIPKDIYDYAFKLSGGGIVQYGLTKVVGEFSARRTGNQPAVQETQQPETQQDNAGGVTG